VGADGDAVKPVLRIIDVNMNRALEGLRVVEEICRFILEDRQLTLSVKKLRGDLSRIAKMSEKLIEARGAEKDVGRKLYTKREGKRRDIQDIFRSNMKRAEEAVRVLEEFSKLLDPRLGQKFKAVRFKLYTIEKKIARKLVVS
jgi:thiamine-phosphate pyrophosphorylase